MAVLAGPADGARAQTQPETEAEILTGLLVVELLVVYAYRRALEIAPLSAPVRSLASLVLTHEHAHVARLSDELARRGAPLPDGPADLAAANLEVEQHSQVPVTFLKAKTEHDWLRLLVGVERVAEGAYYLATAKLTTPRYLSLAAETMASDAQHAGWVALHLHKGEIDKAVPNAFVQGIP